MSEINLADIRGDIEKLLKYIPWLESKSGESVSKVYSDNNLANTSVPFPVYDSTLLSFVNEANATSLMDKGNVWSLGVTEGIYLRVLKKMKSLLEIWDAPLA